MNLYPKTCTVCGNTYHVKRYRIDTALYCSRSCASTVISRMEWNHRPRPWMRGNKLRAGLKPTVAYLVAETVEFADLVHLRPWDTHQTLRLCGEPGAVWEIRRQQEFTPEGWRQVQD